MNLFSTFQWKSPHLITVIRLSDFETPHYSNMGTLCCLFVCFDCWRFGYARANQGPFTASHGTYRPVCLFAGLVTHQTSTKPGSLRLHTVRTTDPCNSFLSHLMWRAHLINMYLCSFSCLSNAFDATSFASPFTLSLFHPRLSTEYPGTMKAWSGWGIYCRVLESVHN